RQQRFPGPRRSDQEDALGDAPAQALELLRATQKLDDLNEFVFGLLHSGNVIEGHLHVVFAIDLGTATPQSHDAAASSHAAIQKHPHTKEQEDGYNPGEDGLQPLTFNPARVLHVVLVQKLYQLRIIDAHSGKQASCTAFDLHSFLEPATNFVLGEDNALHFVVSYQLFKATIGEPMDGFRQQHAFNQKQQ